MELLKEETENFRKTMVEQNINPNMRRVYLDYVFFKEANYQGEKSHQEAAIKTIEALNSWRPLAPPEIIYTDVLYFHNPNALDVFEMPYNEPYAVNPELMNAKQITSEKFFKLNENRLVSDTRIYSDAFLKPPYHDRATVKDFKRMNDYLFPHKETLLIYQWDDDWSNYFSVGKDRWAAAMWTIFDSEKRRFIVIGASIGT